jgi:hypothetical protein
MTPHPRNTFLNTLAKKPFIESASLTEVASDKSLINSNQKIICRVTLDGAKTTVISPHNCSI